MNSDLLMLIGSTGPFLLSPSTGIANAAKGMISLSPTLFFVNVYNIAGALLVWFRIYSGHYAHHDALRLELDLVKQWSQLLLTWEPITTKP